MRQVKYCPACGSQKAIVVVKLDDESRSRFLAYSQIKYAGLLDVWLDEIELVVLKCKVCEHHWYRDQPGELELAAMYAAGRPLRKPSEQPDRNPSSRMYKEMRLLRRLVLDGRRLLDYGSGFGRWARTAMSEGFEVTAYEPSVSRGAEEEKHGFELIHDAALLTGRKFDAINIEQVLEHVPDPHSVLQQIRGLCAPGAIVRITVPNINRTPEGVELWRVWPFDGQRAHTMAPFEHLHGFTPDSLKRVSVRAGFMEMSIYGVVLRGDMGFGLRKLFSLVLSSMSQTKIYLVARQSGMQGNAG